MGEMTKTAKREAEALVCRAEALQPGGVWYAIRSATRREEHVEEGLRAIGVDVYLPVRTVWRRLRQQRDRDHRPLFQGYLFVQCSPADFHRIHDVDGFHQFVTVLGEGLARRPMPFPAEAIGDLMMRQAFGEWDETLEKVERYRPRVGDEVMITGGKWYAYIAEVLSLDPRRRMAKVRIDGGRGAPVTVSYTSLDAA